MCRNKFHAKNNIKCRGQACLSRYLKTDPRVREDDNFVFRKGKPFLSFPRRRESVINFGI